LFLANGLQMLRQPGRHVVEADEASSYLVWVARNGINWYGVMEVYRRSK
jgi:hypothetical protein